ncbi:MAG: hypothetical protein JST58_05655 [Bacteroidetes bacterium]|nr:hypothetical protein [Bacteroidota bacterium]
MKLVVLASPILKEEVQQKFVGLAASVEYVGSMDAFTAIEDADAYFDFDFNNETVRLEKLKKLSTKLVFINAVEHTLADIKLPFIRINAWPGFFLRNISELVANDETKKHAAEKILNDLNFGYRFVPDVPGFISARVVAMIINEAYFTLQEKVSTKTEIDIAMKLGTNYPFGPFEWGQNIGLEKIYKLLIELQKTDNRYPISKALEEEV